MIERTTDRFGRLVFDRNAIVRAALRAYVEGIIARLPNCLSFPAAEGAIWAGDLQRGALYNDDGCGNYLGWALAAAVPVWAACSRDVGECWLPGEDGQGAVGGGPIIPAGAGGFGDVPPEPQTADDPPADCDDESAEAPGGLKVFCKEPDMGATCQSRCLAKEIPCGSIAYHPQKGAMGGTGKLYACNTVLINGYLCSYHYPNGDDCHFYSTWPPHPTWCSYSGGG